VLFFQRWKSGLLDRRRHAWRDDKRERLGSQLLFGEPFTVYETDAETGLAWGQSNDDGYVGYAPLDQLKQGIPGQQTLSAPYSLVFPEPDIKAPITASLPFLARVTAGETSGDFASIGDGWVHVRHIAPIAGDLASFAEAFIGAPYLWGGRSWLGLDCSALIQLSATAIGLDCPRDSDMQEAELGRAISTMLG